MAYREEMFYFLKDRRFDYSDLCFEPPNDEYWGLLTVDPPAEESKVSFKLTSTITRKLDADYIQANRGFLCSRKLRDILVESQICLTRTSTTRQ